MAKLTAGFTCPPLVFAAKKITTDKVRPTKRGFPPEARIERTRSRVPRNSAIRLLYFILLRNEKECRQIRIRMQTFLFL